MQFGLSQNYASDSANTAMLGTTAHAHTLSSQNITKLATHLLIQAWKSCTFQYEHLLFSAQIYSLCLLLLSFLGCHPHKLQHGDHLLLFCIAPVCL